MKFVFFRPSDLGEAVHTGTASRGTWEKNAKVAVCVSPQQNFLEGFLMIYSTEGILPPHAHFDPKWDKLAQKMVYSQMPLYLGHESLVLEHETKAVSPIDSDYILVRDSKGVLRVFENRCCHEFATLIDPTATPILLQCQPKREPPTSCIVCPLHQWTYNLDGSLRGAPKFDMDKIPEERKQLTEVAHRVWNGMIFIQANDKLPWESELGYSGKFDPTLLSLENFFTDGIITSTDYHFSMLIFNSVYLDDRHVDMGHENSFGAVMKMSELELELGTHHSVQVVGWNAKPKRKLCKEYAALHEWIAKLSGATPPKYGAIWSFFNPNLMIEAYPYVTTVSTIVPLEANRCRNIVQHFYSNELKEMVERGELSEEELAEFIAVHKAAYARTSLEDEEFCNRINNGLAQLYRKGRDQRGIPHPIDEAGVIAFQKIFRAVEEIYQHKKMFP